MVRRFALMALAVHVAYALAWWLTAPSSELIFERYAVTVCATVMTIAYAVLVIAYFKAGKTRLNSALAVNKFYLFLLFGLLTLPSLWGVVIRDAPYRVVGNPYSYWIPPGWLRTYIYVFLALSTIGVLWEFYRVNWGPGSHGWDGRERRRWIRRTADRGTVVST
jgi:hypothetical protein